MWKLSYLPTCFEVNSINYFKLINYEHHFTAGNYHFALPGITCLYKNNVTALKSAIKGFIKPVNWTRTFKLQVGITGWLLWKVTWTVWVVVFRMFSLCSCVCVCVCVRARTDAETVYLLLGAVNQLVLVGALIAGTHPFILPESLGMLVEFLEVNREGMFRHGGCSQWDQTSPCHQPWVQLFPVLRETKECS